MLKLKTKFLTHQWGFCSKSAEHAGPYTYTQERRPKTQTAKKPTQVNTSFSLLK